MSPRRFYRILATAEAVTWTGLIAAMVAKYGFGLDAFVFPAGLAHGFVFVSYAATAVIVGLNQRWRTGLIAVGVLTAVIPYATVPFDLWLERHRRLEGGWRTEASDHPADARAIDRLLRWMLARPAVLGASYLVAVVGIVSVLLALGNPKSWGA